ncbi:hypothetical protein AC249_AIPGENE24998, partial [Exaiptasia diaphana]
RGVPVEHVPGNCGWGLSMCLGRRAESVERQGGAIVFEADWRNRHKNKYPKSGYNILTRLQGIKV